MFNNLNSTTGIAIALAHLSTPVPPLSTGPAGFIEKKKEKEEWFIMFFPSLSAAAARNVCMMHDLSSHVHSSGTLLTANIEEDSPLTAAAAERRITKARLCMDTAWTLKNEFLSALKFSFFKITFLPNF